MLTRQVALLAAVLAVLIGVAIVGTVVTARDFRDGAEQARERQDAANDLLVEALTAQSANRGYILVARGDDLQRYTEARDRYGDLEEGTGTVGALVRALEDDPELIETAEAVDRTLNAWFDEAVELIRLRRTGREEQAIRRVNGGTGEVLFDAFRAEYQRLLDEIEAQTEETLSEADRNQTITLIAVIVAAVLALIVVAVASAHGWRRVVGPVGQVAAGVRRVAHGRFSEPVPKEEGAVTELSELVDGFNVMQSELASEREAVAAAARREAAQKTERELWETVQNGLLPERLPSTPGFRIAARYQPSERALLVGGDFYDAVLLNDGRIAVMVGDMAGHGAPAAAAAAGLRFAWRTLVSVNPNPAAVMAALNAQLATPERRLRGDFASAIYALIDTRGSVSFAPAGHPAPLVLSGNGCRPLTPNAAGPLLGVLDEEDWPVTHSALPRGATLVLYTDGLIEARNGDDLFGTERACAILHDERRSALEARLDRLVEAARRHEADTLRDDVVVLAIERVSS